MNKINAQSNISKTQSVSVCQLHVPYAQPSFSADLNQIWNAVSLHPRNGHGGLGGWGGVRVVVTGSRHLMHQGVSASYIDSCQLGGLGCGEWGGVGVKSRGTEQ